MSLVIDLIGQLNCHIIGCKTRLCNWSVRFHRFDTPGPPGFKPFTEASTIWTKLLGFEKRGQKFKNDSLKTTWGKQFKFLFLLSLEVNDFKTCFWFLSVYCTRILWITTVPDVQIVGSLFQVFR